MASATALVKELALPLQEVLLRSGARTTQTKRYPIGQPTAGSHPRRCWARNWFPWENWGGADWKPLTAGGAPPLMRAGSLVQAFLEGIVRETSSAAAPAREEWASAHHGPTKQTRILQLRPVPAATVAFEP